MSKTKEATTMSEKDKAVTMKLGFYLDGEVRYVPDGKDPNGLFLLTEMCATADSHEIRCALHELSRSIHSDSDIYRRSQAKALSTKHDEIKKALAATEKAEKAAEKAKLKLAIALSPYVTTDTNDDGLPF